MLNLIILFVFYRPPREDYDKFLQILSHILKTICNNKVVALADDFNINFFENSVMKESLVNLLTTFNLTQTINTATRVIAT